MTQLAAFKKEFVKNFLNESGYLNDVVLPGGLSDASLRPNQIYAVSLPFSPLSAKQQKSILEIIQKELLFEYEKIFNELLALTLNKFFGIWPSSSLNEVMSVRSENRMEKKVEE